MPFSLNTFLAALPALLAVLAFVVYYLISHQSKGYDLTRDIVEKLRQQSAGDVAGLERLTPQQLAAKIKADYQLRAKVEKNDRDLLERVARQEFVRSLVVYGLIALLFLAGVGSFVYLQSRPTPLALSGWHLESDNPDARGWAVDLDELLVSWKAQGAPEDVSLHLENVQTGRATAPVRVSSAQQRVRFRPEDYRLLLDERERGKYNRVRVAARTRLGVVTSEEFELRVGLKVLAVPVREDQAVWVVAMIDNTSLQNYHYQAKLVVWPRDSTVPVSFGDDMRTPKTVFEVANFDQLNWSTAKIAYFGPDDSRLVRTGLLQ